MKFINAQNVKVLAKEYGEQIRGQPTNVGADFLTDVDRLVEQIVHCAVRTQPDKKRTTLQTTPWLQRHIDLGKAITKETLEE